MTNLFVLVIMVNRNTIDIDWDLNERKQSCITKVRGGDVLFSLKKDFFKIMSQLTFFFF